MAVFSGPEIVNDGLVFYYDIDNQKKSWKGKPTTNFVNTNLSEYAKDNGCTVELQPTTFDGNPIYRVTFPSGTLPRIRINFTYTASQQFTGSIFYRVVIKGSHNPQLIFREAGFGTTYATRTLTSQEWIKATITHTFSNSGTSMFLLYQSSSSSTSPTVIDFSMPQSELSSFATPFVNGTRSNTQAILDLTNNNTVTATSLTYASNNTFSFNGIDNSITISNGISYASGFTLAAWINPQSIGGGTFGRIFDKTPALGTTSGFAFYLSGTNQLNFSVNNIGTLTTASSTISLNNWQYVLATVTSAGAAAIYINAVSRASGTTGATSGITTTNLLTVGNRSGATDRTFDGDIDVASAYNRALTLQEIAQNFEAMRDRYDI